MAMRVKYTVAIVCALSFMLPTAAFSATPNYSKDVAPIMNSKCVQCHRPDDIAPMSLMTYEEARPWAKSIAKQVEAREMPPWDPSPEFHGVFSNEITLTDVQIETLVKWVNTGAARGRPGDAPCGRSGSPGSCQPGELRCPPPRGHGPRLGVEVGSEVRGIRGQ